MSKVTGQSPIPRAHIHKKILDTANARPKASIEELSSDISGASPELVERVLDEYGDPQEEDTDSVVEITQSEPTLEKIDSDTQAVPSSANTGVTDLTDKQRETLWIIYEHPHLTQQDLAEHFNVSAATICTRVNAINGFEWDDRRKFVEDIFAGEYSMKNGSDPEATTKDTLDQLDTIDERISKLEAAVDNHTDPTSTLTIEPPLLQKTIHACIKSDTITEDEELEILRTLMPHS